MCAKQKEKMDVSYSLSWLSLRLAQQGRKTSSQTMKRTEWSQETTIVRTWLSSTEYSNLDLDLAPFS
jgi:hypothetical protein